MRLDSSGRIVGTVAGYSKRLANMDNQTITANGLSFLVRVRADDCGEMPWEREDGHGPVRKVRANFTGYPNKKPGEVVLYSDFPRGGWVYDFAEAMRIAKRDGWGVADSVRAAAEAANGHALTAGELAELAVTADYNRLRAFMLDQWGYVGVVVALLDVDGNPTQHGESVWGIESDWDEGIADYAQELANEVAARVGRCSFVSHGSSKLRVRPLKPRKVKA